METDNIVNVFAKAIADFLVAPFADTSLKAAAPEVADGTDDEPTDSGYDSSYNFCGDDLPYDPGLIPAQGRITRGFDSVRAGRVWQAEQILRSFDRWPPEEGDVFAIHIDQDSPPPPTSDRSDPDGFNEPHSRPWRKAMKGIEEFLVTYTGELSIFRASRKDGWMALEEIVPDGPLSSASHPAQIDPKGQSSCTGGVCGMAWLRSGIYLFKGKYEWVFNPVYDSQMGVARDLNRDGVIDADESAASDASYGIALQIHSGFHGAPRSAGCQTMPPEDYEVFRGIIEKEEIPYFSYVLVRRPNDLTGAHVW